MKNLKITLSLMTVFAMSSISAQETRKIADETAEKTYKIISNDKVIKNSVKVNTTINQEMAFAEEDKGKVDQRRVMPPKKITKTVLIDNNEDDAYDEKIVFSYMAHDKSDFTLVTNKDQVVVGIDEGENLKIQKSESINKKDLKESKEAYVFTKDDGEEVQFFIESYETLK